MTTLTTDRAGVCSASADRRRAVAVVLTYAVLAAALGVSVWGGVELRRWAWHTAEPIRFLGDIRNAFNQGRRANELGYLNVYDQLVDRNGTDGQFGLDYPPLRLLVAARWIAWLEAHEPGIDRWRNEYALTQPLLRLNLAMELASAVAMFLLVRLWVRRQHDALARPAEMRAAVVGALAALLLWFNPALILEAHAWPQWDAWALPFFLWSLLMVSLGRLGTAGFLIAVGAMLKGQVLLVAPVLVLIPLLRGQWYGLLRMAVGLALGGIVCVGPWLLPDGPAVKLAGGLAGLAGLSIWALSRRGWRCPGVQAAAGLAVIAGVLVAAWACGGSFAWYHVGFGYAPRNHYRMAMGPVANLPTLLRDGWRWGLDDPFPLPWLGTFATLRTLMIGAYAATLAWCGVVAARCAAKRRTMFLVAATLPWVTMFALMPQMHERYLLWGAVCSAAWVALGVGPMLLHLLLTGLAYMMIIRAMIGRRHDELPALREFIDGAIPDIAWALLLMVLVLLWWITTARAAGETERPQTD